MHCSGFNLENEKKLQLQQTDQGSQPQDLVSETVSYNI